MQNTSPLLSQPLLLSQTPVVVCALSTTHSPTCLRARLHPSNTVFKTIMAMTKGSRLLMGAIHGKQVVVSGGLGPASVLAALAALALGIGAGLLGAQLQMAQLRIRYDNAPPMSKYSTGGNGSNQLGAITDVHSSSWGQPVERVVTVVVDRDIRAPVTVYYQLDDFIQGHKRYVRSVSWSQVAADGRPDEHLEVCDPQSGGHVKTYERGNDAMPIAHSYLGGAPNASLPLRGAILPCGLVAASLFNDSFSLSMACPDGSSSSASSSGSNGTPLVLDEAAAAPLRFNADALFGSPQPITNLNTRPADRLGGSANGTIAANPRLINWMRVAAHPTVTKTLAIIHTDLHAGCVLHLHVVDAYRGTTRYDGAKSLLLAGPTSWWSGGMRNLVLPCILLGAGGAALLAAVALLAWHVLVHRRQPRWNTQLETQM